MLCQKAASPLFLKKKKASPPIKHTNKLNPRLNINALKSKLNINTPKLKLHEY